MKVDYTGVHIPITGQKLRVKSDGICPDCHTHWFGDFKVGRGIQICPECGHRWRTDTYGRPHINPQEGG